MDEQRPAGPINFGEPLTKSFHRWLSEMQSDFEMGKRYALFEVVAWCATLQATVPEWAVDALIAIKDVVDHGRIANAEDFGNALGPPGRPVARKKATQMKERTGDILMVLGKLREEGRAFDNACFEEAKERLSRLGLNLSRGQIEGIYKEFGRDWLKQKPQGESMSGGGFVLLSLSDFKMRGRPLLDIAKRKITLPNPTDGRPRDTPANQTPEK